MMRLIYTFRCAAGRMIQIQAECDNDHSMRAVTNTALAAAVEDAGGPVKFVGLHGSQMAEGAA